jgi:BirA family biotin operon repressor/biotin-[acetyl-CoA-carboxylase] ligase
MAAMDEVLRILEARRGEAVSGEQMAADLGLSRAAVWKAVSGLKDRGFRITAGPNRGYTLESDGGILHPETIRRHLRAAGDYRLRVYDRVEGSTNDLAREAAVRGEAEGLVVIADTQTAGRGRQGRAFVSPPGTGTYLSLLLRPKLPAAEAVAITGIAAVAVARALGDLGVGGAGIKWVNDIFLEGRKVCGILTEATLDMESGGLDYAVLGIGVNLFSPPGGFPPELTEIAGAVFPGKPEDDERSRLIAAILDRFLPLYRALPDKGWLEEYRARSILTGREVRFLREGREQRGLVLGVDDSARLLLRLSDGEETALSSGEVQLVRPLEDKG